MRQIFEALPWVHPEVPAPIIRLYEKRGIPVRVKKNEVLKAGGENPKCFLLVHGLCVYRVAGERRRSPSILSVIIPGRSMCDISASVNERVNVETVAWQESTVLAMPPGALEEEAARDPVFSRLLLQDVIAKQESHIEGMVANFTLAPEERLKTFFKVLLTAYGTPIRQGWMVMPLLLNNEQYGQIVNLTRVSVSRTLSRWVEAGLVRKNGRSIAVREELFSDCYDWLGTAGGTLQPHIKGYGPAVHG